MLLRRARQQQPARGPPSERRDAASTSGDRVEHRSLADYDRIFGLTNEFDRSEFDRSEFDPREVDEQVV